MTDARTDPVVPDDPAILAAVEARKKAMRRTEAICNALLDQANDDGLELLALLIEARVMFEQLSNGRPGVSGQQVREWIKRADTLVNL